MWEDIDGHNDGASTSHVKVSGVREGRTYA